jgi:hypothetical protein
VYIRYLRNKVDKGFDSALILTRWGEGYMLRGPDTVESEGLPRVGKEVSADS